MMEIGEVLNTLKVAETTIESDESESAEEEHEELQEGDEPKEGGESSGAPKEGGESSGAPKEGKEKNKWAPFGLEEKPNRYFFRIAAGKEVGYLRAVRPGIKAICRSHNKCSCWISKAPAGSRAEEDIVAWLAEDTSARGHEESSFALKVKHGMKPRPLPPA